MAGGTEGIEVFLCDTRLESSVNLEEFLRAMGQNLVMRKVSLALKPVCSLSRTVDAADGTEIYSQTLVLSRVGMVNLTGEDSVTGEISKFHRCHW